MSFINFIVFPGDCQRSPFCFICSGVVFPLFHVPCFLLLFYLSFFHCFMCSFVSSMFVIPPCVLFVCGCFMRFFVIRALSWLYSF